MPPGVAFTRGARYIIPPGSAPDSASAGTGALMCQCIRSCALLDPSTNSVFDLRTPSGTRMVEFSPCAGVQIMAGVERGSSCSVVVIISSSSSLSSVVAFVVFFVVVHAADNPSTSPRPKQTHEQPQTGHHLRIPFLLRTRRQHKTQHRSHPLLRHLCAR